MSTHICLVSEQPLPNLLGALTLRPTEVVLLTSDQMGEVCDACLRRHLIV